MTLRISSASTTYVKVPVTFKLNGQITDPTGYDVELAFTASEDDPPTSWTAGSWETANDTYLARVLTGPDGDVDPGVGVWIVWVRIDANPEMPALPSADVEIF
jgi:hypothetical protein